MKFVKNINIYKNILTNIANYIAILEGIAAITGNTCARGLMIDNLTLGKLSTNARTWILAFRLYTSKSGYAICINNAFRSTSVVRIADIIW